MSAEDVLARRARALANPPAELAQDVAAWLAFRVGEARLAVPLARAATVLAPSPVAALPKATGSAIVAARPSIEHAGFLALGDVGPAVGAVSERPTHAQFVVVVDDRRAPLGILVDEVLGVEPARDVVEVDVDRQLVRGVAAGRLQLLDVDVLLRDPRFGAEPDPDPDRTEGTE